MRCLTKKVDININKKTDVEFLFPTSSVARAHHGSSAQSLREDGVERRQMRGIEDGGLPAEVHLEQRPQGGRGARPSFRDTRFVK